GVDEDLYANPARTFWTGPSGEYERVAAWVVNRFAGVRAAIDSVTADAAAKVAGDLFTNRRARAGAPVASVPAPALTEEQESAREVASLVDPEDVDLDATAELAPVAANVALPEAKPSTEEARELLDELVAMLASVGPGTVAVRDLKPYLEQIGRDRSWVSREMKRLADEGRLAATGEEGVYRLLPVLASV
ncbi:sporulation protein SsgA, partial [Streptomyces prunicolor]|nr:sporulation protein SsgA [Streptomyces prunicolor]